MAKFQRPAAPASRDLVGKVYPYLLPVLLFLAVTAISRQFAVGFAVVCILLALGRTPLGQLRRRFSPLTAAVVLYSLVYQGVQDHRRRQRGEAAAQLTQGRPAQGQENAHHGEADGKLAADGRYRQKQQHRQEVGIDLPHEVPGGGSGGALEFSQGTSLLYHII